MDSNLLSGKLKFQFPIKSSYFKYASCSSEYDTNYLLTKVKHQHLSCPYVTHHHLIQCYKKGGVLRLC